jgi:hypothetical protein
MAFSFLFFFSVRFMHLKKNCRNVHQMASLSKKEKTMYRTTVSMRDTIMVTKDLRVTMSHHYTQTAIWAFDITVSRATDTGVWKTIMDRQVESRGLSSLIYNGGHFEKYDDGTTIMLVTPLFILTVSGQRCEIYSCLYSPARLVVNNGNAWAVESVANPVYEHRCTRVKMTRLFVADPLDECGTRKRPLDIAFGVTAWNMEHIVNNCTVLDATWDAARDSIMCLIGDDGIWSFGLHLVEMSSSRDPRVITTFRNNYFRGARGIAAMFLDDSAFVCALRMSSLPGMGIDESMTLERLQAHSIFLRDCRSCDVSFFKGASMSRLHATYKDHLTFTQIDGSCGSNYVFLQQTGKYAFSDNATLQSFTRMHIFDLRTMTCVDTVQTSLPSQYNTHVRMTPRVVAPDPSKDPSKDPAVLITIDAYRTSYGKKDGVKRAPVRSLDGRIWDPLVKSSTNAFHAPMARRSTSASDRASTLVYGHPAPLRGHSARLNWAPRF